MFLFIKDAIIIGVSIITALLISIGLVPERAVAPDVTPPAVIVQNPEEEVPAPTTTVEVAPENVGIAEIEPKESPLIDDFEKSLQEALDALEKIKQEENAQQQPLQTGLNETVRGAVVNILCTTAGAGPLNPISASGVVIDPRGIILTNAHVAQYYLLEDYPVLNFIECVIRTGSPATPKYTSELLFIPPSWVTKNAHKVDDENPTGNGEHDYALVLITGLVSNKIVAPASFPHLKIAVAAPDIGDSMLAAGYPAGFLGGITIQKELYASSASVIVQELYTFKETTIDLFSIGGSVVAQQGSSGGAVARDDGALSGLIVTSSTAEDTASRELRAISTEYILRDFFQERGISLADYLGGNLLQEKTLFEQNTKPTLSAALISVLER